MASKRISRRDFLRMSGLVSGLAVLAACAPKVGEEPTAEPTTVAGPTAAPSMEEVTLVVWSSDWGKDYNDPMINLGDLYKEDVAPNVTLEWTFMPSVNEKLIAAVAGGNPPDVAMMQLYEIQDMARTDGLVSLEPYFERDGLKGEDFIPSVWQTVLYDGVPYGMPGGAGTSCLIYDKATFEEVGIDPDSLPDTPSWSQFADWCDTLTKKDSSGEVVRIGYVPESWAFEQFAAVLGATYFNADLTKITINSPESVAAVEKWSSLLPPDVPYEDIAAALASAPTSAYGTLGVGLVGLVMEGYWLFLGMDNYWPDMDYGVTKLPTPNGTKEEWKLYGSYPWDMSIPRGAKNADEAWGFLKFGFWERGALLADTINFTSALKEVPEFEERTIAIMGADNRETPYLHHFSEASVASAFLVPYTPITRKLRDAVGQAVDAVIRGEGEAEAALSDVVEALQPELDRALASD